MSFIIETLKHENPTIEDLLTCFDMVLQDGNVAMIKFDGERMEKSYTVMISFPGKKQNLGLIRNDGDNLKVMLTEVLQKYVKTTNIA